MDIEQARSAAVFLNYGGVLPKYPSAPPYFEVQIGQLLNESQDLEPWSIV